jgi:hypothetical protein
LDIAHDAFSLLVVGPAPLAIDGRTMPGLPARLVPLDEVRDLLCTRDCGQDMRDGVWSFLVRQARTGGPAWTVACVGVAHPHLVGLAAKLTKRFYGDPTEIHDEVLSGFLAGLATMSPDQSKIPTKLWWAARRAGQAAPREARQVPIPMPDQWCSRPPTPPSGHPDLILASAVADAVLTPIEADVIGRTRLEDVQIADWAAEREADYWTAYRVRERAERRLVRYLLARAADADPDTPRPKTAAPRPQRTARSTSTEPPARSLSVSGRLRNGADPRTSTGRKSRGPVFKSGPKSGEQVCGGTPPAQRPIARTVGRRVGPTRTPEVHSCA